MASFKNQKTEEWTRRTRQIFNALKKAQSHSIGKLGAHGIEDHCRGDEAKALQGLWISAIRFQARNAGKT